jgi:hypothetical protein
MLMDQKRASVPTRGTLRAVAVAALVAFYTAMCVTQIAVLHHSQQQINGLFTHPSATSLATVESFLAVMRAVGDVYVISFWVMLASTCGYMWLLPSRLPGRSGRPLWRTAAGQVWIVGIVISVALNIALGLQPLRADAYRLLMASYVIRAAIGIAYLWVIVSLWRATATVADSELLREPTPAVADIDLGLQTNEDLGA